MEFGLSEIVWITFPCLKELDFPEKKIATRRRDRLDVGYSFQNEFNTNAGIPNRVSVSMGASLDWDNFEVDYGFFDGLEISLDVTESITQECLYECSYDFRSVGFERREISWIV